MAEIKLKTNSNPHIDLSDPSSNTSINISSDSISPHIAMNDMSSTPAVAMSNIVPTKLLGVKDVLVDGASVVSDNVANIVLAPVCFTGDYDDLIDKPTNVSAFINDAGYLTVETDPTVPSWAKEESKPSYTASEISGLIDMFYPVGSYYETSDADFDPNEAWGGTWELEAEGQVHVSAGDNYTISGALMNTSDDGEVTHKLTNDELPKITGSIAPLAWKSNGASGAFSYGTSSFNLRNPNAGTTNSLGTQYYNFSIGGNLEHNNMQPYIVVNRWHRTA